MRKIGFRYGFESVFSETDRDPDFDPVYGRNKRSSEHKKLFTRVTDPDLNGYGKLGRIRTIFFFFQNVRSGPKLEDSY